MGANLSFGADVHTTKQHNALVCYSDKSVDI